MKKHISQISCIIAFSAVTSSFAMAEGIADRMNELRYGDGTVNSSQLIERIQRMHGPTAAGPQKKQDMMQGMEGEKMTEKKYKGMEHKREFGENNVMKHKHNMMDDDY